MEPIWSEPIATENPPRDGKGKNIILWVFQVTGSVVFSLVGVAKIVGTEAEVQLFEAIGLGQWFRYFTGALELTGAFALLIPSTARLGALLLMMVMAGATFSHLTLLHTSPALPLGMMVLVALIAFGRRKSRTAK